MGMIEDARGRPLPRRSSGPSSRSSTRGTSPRASWAARSGSAGTLPPSSSGCGTPRRSCAPTPARCPRGGNRRGARDSARFIVSVRSCYARPGPRQRRQLTVPSSPFDRARRRRGGGPFSFNDLALTDRAPTRCRGTLRLEQRGRLVCATRQHGRHVVNGKPSASGFMITEAELELAPTNSAWVRPKARTVSRHGRAGQGVVSAPALITATTLPSQTGDHGADHDEEETAHEPVALHNATAPPPRRRQLHAAWQAHAVRADLSVAAK